MLNRIFKTIFILTLCLGITLPANAGSVDVSDGSAFITKSEMAYQLNNLSNRMTQLENSLDSKIDTLVSSYLTRNGIWNGIKQTLKNYYIVDCCGNNATAITAKSVTHGYRDFQGKTQTYSPTVKSQITFPTAMNSDNLLHKVDRTTLEIVEKCNKTGLLYITFNVATLASVFNMTADDRTYLTWKPPIDASYNSTARLTYIGWIMEWCANGNSFYRCDMMYQNCFDRIYSNPTARTGEEATRYLCFTTPYNQFKIFTFVNKDDKITLKDYFEFKKNTNAGKVDSVDHASYSGVICTVDDCAIY